MEYRLELVPVPVADVDRAKAFYTEKIGFEEDLDHRAGDEFRVVQLTPPGSACSIAVGTGIVGTAPVPSKVCTWSSRTSTRRARSSPTAGWKSARSKTSGGFCTRHSATRTATVGPFSSCHSNPQLGAPSRWASRHLESTRVVGARGEAPPVLRPAADPGGKGSLR